jgi:hypothetical protein
MFLRDRDGSELMNHSSFDQFRRFTGSSTVSYAPAGDAPAATAPPRPAPPVQPRPGKAMTASLDARIGEDAAIGDSFTATTTDGVQLAGRITDMRRAGKNWTVELTLPGTVRRLALPVKAGTKLAQK